MLVYLLIKKLVLLDLNFFLVEGFQNTHA